MAGIKTPKNSKDLKNQDEEAGACPKDMRPQPKPGPLPPTRVGRSKGSSNKEPIDDLI